MKNPTLLLIALCTAGLSHSQKPNENKMSADSEVATFGAGCFWCTEAVFLNVKGVTKVESGYSGGTVKNPSYREVCTGQTGHAEVTQITFDPGVISFEGMLEANKAVASDEAKKKSEPRVSLTDPEARSMRFADGAVHAAYNAQIGADLKTGIVVAVAMTDRRNDSGLALPFQGCQ